MGNELSVIIENQSRTLSLTPPGTPPPSPPPANDDGTTSANAVAAGASPANANDGATNNAVAGGANLLGQVSPLTPATPATPATSAAAAAVASSPGPLAEQPITPAAADAAASYVLFEIPDDVSRCIFECMDLPTKVKFSILGKTLATAVYSQSYLWIEIDCADLSWKQRPLFTDRSLHRLLENVQAKDVTKFLSVRRCWSIQGFGLEPLRGSVVIEELDLRVKQNSNEVDAQTGLHDTFVLNLLPSMMPLARPTESNQRSAITSRLFTVRFNKQRNPSNNTTGGPMRMSECFHSYSQLKKWMESFDASLKDRLWIDRVPCTHCESLLVEKIPNETFESTDASAIRCVRCKNLTCGQNNCPATSRCQRCFDDLCCVEVKKCDSCQKDICEYCSLVEKCQGPCNRTLCERCCQVDKCSACNKSFCEGCRTTMYCQLCDDLFCTECTTVTECGGCCEWFCEGCTEDPFYCLVCTEPFCSYCDQTNFNICDGCQGLICDGCLPLSFTPCGGCDGMYCQECREISEACAKCLEQYCSDCHDTFEVCQLCKGCTSCCPDVAWCQQCEYHYGKHCREVLECRDCGKGYCTDCSATDSGGGGGLFPCASCNEPLCAECRPDTDVAMDGGCTSELDLLVLLCHTCSDNVEVAAPLVDAAALAASDQSPCKKTKASDLLFHQLCELKLERARARRRLEAAEKKVYKVEEKLLIRDPGWFPCDILD